jgi:hypothetical protein
MTIGFRVGLKERLLFSFILVCGALLCAAAPKYAPLQGGAARPLSAENAYFRAQGVKAPDYWALASFYAPQETAASCSAASAAMALNALLNAGRERGDEDENLSEEAVTAKAKSFDWKGLVARPDGAGRRGLKLERLAAGLREALDGLGAKGATVKTSQFEAATPEALAAFRAALAGNEASARDIMLVHFTQDTLTGAPGGPFAHISPVGAYDAKNRLVLIMDVDRRWYEPYWVADELLLKAMAAETEAFGRGGYALVSLATVK